MLPVMKKCIAVEIAETVAKERVLSIRILLLYRNCARTQLPRGCISSCSIRFTIGTHDFLLCSISMLQKYQIKQFRQKRIFFHLNILGIDGVA